MMQSSSEFSCVAWMYTADSLLLLSNNSKQRKEMDIALYGQIKATCADCVPASKAEWD